MYFIEQINFVSDTSNLNFSNTFWALGIHVLPSFFVEYSWYVTYEIDYALIIKALNVFRALRDTHDRSLFVVAQIGPQSTEGQP